MKRLIIAVTILVFWGCANEGSQEQKDSLHNGDSVKLSDTAAVFVSPGPLQAAAYLRYTGIKASFHRLSELTAGINTATVEYHKAVYVGILLADVGYCALYKNHDLTTRYAQRADVLLEDLKLDGVVQPYWGKLKKNLKNADSLSAFVIESYRSLQDVLNTSGREKLAMSMMSGVLLESLVLTLADTSAYNDVRVLNILGQQKLWTKNLLQAATYLPYDEETQDLYNTFYTLDVFLEPVVAEMNDNKLVVRADIDTLRKLFAKSIQLRDQVVYRQ